VATNGIECGCQLMEFAPDLIILDLAMPELGGMKTIRYLRAGSHKAIRMLVVSGFVEGDDRRFLEQNGIPFLAKPVDFKVLTSVIRDMGASDP